LGAAPAHETGVFVDRDLTTMSSRQRSAAPVGASSRLIRLGVWASAVLVVLAAGALYFVSTFAHNRKQAAGAVVVAITGRTCDPDQLTVSAGRTTFQIANHSDRVVEWEILDGVMVVAERENIAPGFTQSLSANLEPGDYSMTCGLLGNPRGQLHVTPSRVAVTGAPHPLPRAYIGPLAEYRVYLMREAGQLAPAVGGLADAIAQGNLPLSRSLYISAHRIYMHIEPVAELFADLDQRIDAHANDFEQRERDPSFTGFHRIESGLFAQDSIGGIAPVARQLVADVGALQERVRTLKTPPERLARGAARSMQKLAEGIADGASANGAVALSDARGRVDGVVETVGLLRPLLIRADAALQARIDADLKNVQAELDRMQPSAMDRSAHHDGNRPPLVAQLKTLATDLAAVNTRLGLIE
jgi:iron uptake system component EfeO